MGIAQNLADQRLRVPTDLRNPVKPAPRVVDVDLALLIKPRELALPKRVERRGRLVVGVSGEKRLEGLGRIRRGFHGPSVIQSRPQLT